jgi:hypothetical protein
MVMNTFWKEVEKLQKDQALLTPSKPSLPNAFFPSFHFSPPSPLRLSFVLGSTFYFSLGAWWHERP